MLVAFHNVLRDEKLVKWLVYVKLWCFMQFKQLLIGSHNGNQSVYPAFMGLPVLVFLLCKQIVASSHGSDVMIIWTPAKSSIKLQEERLPITGTELRQNLVSTGVVGSVIIFRFKNNGIKKCTCWKTMGFIEKQCLFFLKQCFWHDFTHDLFW